MAELLRPLSIDHGVETVSVHSGRRASFQHRSNGEVLKRKRLPVGLVISVIGCLCVRDQYHTLAYNSLQIALPDRTCRRNQLRRRRPLGGIGPVYQGPANENIAGASVRSAKYDYRIEGYSVSVPSCSRGMVVETCSEPPATLEDGYSGRVYNL